MHRSFLFVPGDSERKIAKSWESGADALILDLEDSVAISNKDSARRMTADVLSQHADVRKFVRVNPVTTDLIDADLNAIADHPPEGLMLPKCAGLHDIESLSEKLDAIEAAHGHTAGSIKIFPVATETAVALRNLMRSDWAHHRLFGLTWGAEDIAADIGAVGNREDGVYSGVFRLARDISLLAAREARVLAIDTAFVHHSDRQGCADESRRSANAGFDGKIAIHPAQVPIINEAFTPNEAKIIWARRVREALGGGAIGVAVLDGQMLDMPHQKLAEHILRSVGELSEDAARPKV